MKNACDDKADTTKLKAFINQQSNANHEEDIGNQKENKGDRCGCEPGAALNHTLGEPLLPLVNNGKKYIFQIISDLLYH